MNVSGSVPVRGRTALSGNPGRTIDATMLAHLEGTEQWFDDIDPTGTSGPKTHRSNRRILCMLVRNESAGVLLPGYVVTWQSGQRGKRVDGYSRTTSQISAGVVDEFLPSGGVAIHDLFWLCVKGPSLMKTPLEGNANNVFNLDDLLYALTAVTSGATTAGRVVTWGLTATSTGTTDNTLTQNILNAFGRALSAATTANTNANILVDTFFVR